MRPPAHPAFLIFAGVTATSRTIDRILHLALSVQVLKLLEHAIASVQEQALSNEPVYSTATLFGRFVTANQFITEIQALFKEIEKKTPLQHREK